MCHAGSAQHLTPRLLPGTKAPAVMPNGVQTFPLLQQVNAYWILWSRVTFLTAVSPLLMSLAMALSRRLSLWCSSVFSSSVCLCHEQQISSRLSRSETTPRNLPISGNGMPRQAALQDFDHDPKHHGKRGNGEEGGGERAYPYPSLVDAWCCRHLNSLNMWQSSFM